MGDNALYKYHWARFRFLSFEISKHWAGVLVFVQRCNCVLYFRDSLSDHWTRSVIYSIELLVPPPSETWGGLEVSPTFVSMSVCHSISLPTQFSGLFSVVLEVLIWFFIYEFVLRKHIIIKFNFCRVWLSLTWVIILCSNLVSGLFSVILWDIDSYKLVLMYSCSYEVL